MTQTVPRTGERTQIPAVLKDNIPFSLALFVLVCNLLFRELLGINEQDVLANAKQFADSTWIPNDWYLNQTIGYRSTFNAIAGLMTRLMPLYLVAIVGRLAVYILFSAALQKLVKTLRVNPVFVLPIVYVFWGRQSLMAGEWMVGSFEAKSLAYVFVLFALHAFLERKWGTTFLFSGLAISLHVLVGGFAFFCLAFSFLICHRSFAGETGPILKKALLLPVAASPAVFAVSVYLLENRGVDSALAGHIYTVFRMPHHAFMRSWSLSFAPQLLFGSLLLGIVILHSNSLKRRILASYIMGSLILFSIGTSLFLAGKYHLLKFYWFRISDTMFPLFLLFFLALYINDYLLWLKRRPPGEGWIEPLIQHSGKVIMICVAALSLFAAGRSMHRIGSYAADMTKGKGPFYFAHIERNLLDVTEWIRMNTPRDAAFLISPDFEYFYLTAERAEFVSIKHSPQSDKHIIEWFERLKLVNHGKDPVSKGSHFKLCAELEEAFYSLPQDMIVDIGKRYRLGYYLGKSGRSLPFQTLYSNGKYTLYKLDPNEPAKDR